MPCKMLSEGQFKLSLTLLYICGGLLLISNLVQVESTTKIKLNSNYRFENVLISSDVESFFTPDNMRKLTGFLTKFSADMAIATEAVGRKISVENVRVLVPESKVDDLKAAGFTFEQLTWETVDNADIKLDTYGTEAKAIPADQCYDASNYVKMPYFMTLRNSSSIYLLRAFAQLRWGVLTEVNSTYNFYLNSTSSYSPTVCSVNTPGHYTLLSTGQRSPNITHCIREIIRRESFNFLEDLSNICEFTADTADASSRSCLLSQAVSLFCDNTTGQQTSHNREANNPHNTKCASQSAAEVLWKHNDFSSALSGSPSSITDPKIILIEPKWFRNIVVVMDLSGSMIGDRLQNLIRAATLYVKYFVETGAVVSIVSFNETVHVMQVNKTVTDQAVRELLATAIQGMMAKGWTNIADAITKSMELLGATQPYSKSQTGFVVLITDGEHNIGPSLDDAIVKATKTSIVFDTLCISDKADSQMAKLASETGGLKLFSAENTPISVEQDIAFSRLAERSVNSSSSDFKLLKASRTAVPTNQTVKVDNSITTALHFMITIISVDLSTINFTVQSPSGNRYDRSSGSSVYLIETAINTITIKIPNAEIMAGDWLMYVSSTSASGRRRRDVFSSEYSDQHSRAKRSTTSGSIVVVGGSSGGSSINVDAWLRFSSFAKVTSETVQKIYVYITNSSAPLVNATIEASVVPATGSAFIIELKDDGLGSDLTRNDGIYVALILPEKMTTVGDYGVTIVVKSPFNRVTSAGTFRVESLATGSVAVPPGRVTDLTVASSIKNQSVFTQFTSPGNQAYEGAAASYQIRASNSFDQVSNSFDSCQLVATITGQAVGTTIQVTIWASNFTNIDTNRTFYLSAVAVSTSGIRGEPSFPIGTSLTYPNGWTPSEVTTSILSTTTGLTTTVTGKSSTIYIGTESSNVTPSSTTLSQVTDSGSEWSDGMIAAAAVLSAVLLAECIAIVVVAVKL